MKKFLLFTVGLIIIAQSGFSTVCGSASVIPGAPTMPYVQALTCGAGNDVNSGGGGGGNYSEGGSGGLGWVPAGTGCSPSVGGLGGISLNGHISPLAFLWAAAEVQGTKMMVMEQ